MISFNLRSSVLSISHFALPFTTAGLWQGLCIVPGSSRCLWAGVKACGQQCSWGWGTPSHSHFPSFHLYFSFTGACPGLVPSSPFAPSNRASCHLLGASSQGENMGKTWQPSEVTLLPRCSQSNPRCLAIIATDIGGARFQQAALCLSWAVLVLDENKAGATGNEAKQHTER